jgi:hypothetical protein
MLPFRIEDVNPELVADMSEVITEAVDGKYPAGTDSAVNIANAQALAVVCVWFVQHVAHAFNVDATELFEGIADAIDDGSLGGHEVI